MTIDPIAAKAEALWAKRPALRPSQLCSVGGRFQLAIRCMDQAHAASWEWVNESTTPLAHMLIEAACVRWLTARGHSIVWAQEGPITTEALIAACMEAGQ